MTLIVLVLLLPEFLLQYMNGHQCSDGMRALLNKRFSIQGRFFAVHMVKLKNFH